MTPDKEMAGAEMDPITGAGVAKAAAAAGEETGKLLGRVLGPAADEIGEALRRYTAFRMRNVGRIAEKAEKKARGKGGEVPPRLAHKLLEDGSYCDDEMMAEYLSGLLAAGKTPNGRDDRAVVWSSVVTSMSTLQLRAHFLLYREWAVRLKSRDDVKLDLEVGRSQSAMFVYLHEFIPHLTRDLDVKPGPALTHAITGLVRTGLLAPNYAWGPREEGPLKDSPYDASLWIAPTQAGIELYGWAQGEPGMTGPQFTARALSFAEEEFPRLATVSLPNLPAV